jgi:hypothetical protein
MAKWRGEFPDPPQAPVLHAGQDVTETFDLLDKFVEDIAAWLKEVRETVEGFLLG